jgi:hypothetical protein
LNTLLTPLIGLGSICIQIVTIAIIFALLIGLKFRVLLIRFRQSGANYTLSALVIKTLRGFCFDPMIVDSNRFENMRNEPTLIVIVVILKDKPSGNRNEIWSRSVWMPPLRSAITRSWHPRSTSRFRRKKQPVGNSSTLGHSIDQAHSLRGTPIILLLFGELSHDNTDP